jgi:capsular polysaccharide biosynthesis protein
MRRLNTPVRRLVNEEGVLQMLRDTFSENEVQLLNIQASDGIEKTRASVQKCGIFLGTHGAGMINEIYTLKDSIIFEMVPENRPAYYRNCAVLRGLKYVGFGIRGTTETKSVTVDVSTLRDALRSIMHSGA